MASGVWPAQPTRSALAALTAQPHARLPRHPQARADLVLTSVLPSPGVLLAPLFVWLAPSCNSDPLSSISSSGRTLSALHEKCVHHRHIRVIMLFHFLYWMMRQHPGSLLNLERMPSPRLIPRDSKQL